jgi:hypothetical protein
MATNAFQLIFRVFIQKLLYSPAGGKSTFEWGGTLLISS